MGKRESQIRIKRVYDPPGKIAGVGAKSFLSERIALEAKKPLAHTDETIAEISEMQGIDEVTDFVKFFRREADRTPGEFREQHKRP